MADVNANIGVQIDTSDALAQLKNLQRQLAQFHTSVAKSSNVAAAAQKNLQKNLVNSINSIGAFSAELRTVKTSAESFTDSLEKNKFSMREYFRYAGASTKTFGKMFTAELDTISKVAEDRVKKLQTQYIKLGRDSQGAMKAIAVMPNQLDFSKTSTQLQIAAQKQAIFNQLLKQGSTNLLNFGKNTQWAGRQLMVGFTVPLGILGMKASQTFMDMEKAALKFKKVYGDLLTSPEETKAALDGITELGKQYTKYGVAVADTVSLSAEAAAAGFQGLDLQRQTAQATRLSVLGQIEAQQALETTIALQNAFKMSSEDLAGSINFLNAVENQTVTSLDDITTAIPKVAPVIQQLGGDVKDLAFFITAMKEGGINASEGANALKSGLAALINPTSKATAMLADMGINITKIVESNKGDLKATVIGFAQALDTLDPLARARAIEQMFGKFQFARLSTLFQNVTRDGTQAGRVLKLAGTSIEDLASLAEKELGMTAASPMNQFKKAVEDLKLALVPVGETFLKAVTPIVEFFGNILEKFSGLSDNTKKIITIITIALAGVGPVLLMTFGLLANGVANIIKLFATLRNGYLKLTGQSTVLGEQTQYMTTEQLEAAAAAHSLNQSHATLKQTFDVEKASLDQLIASYQSATRASAAFAAANPGAMLPIPGRKKPKKFSVGKPYIVGGSGNRDSEPAMLTPGETVIPADMSKKYGGLINGMIAGNIPGYNGGLFPTYTNAVSLLSSGANQGLKNKSGYSAAALSSEFAAGGAGIQAPIVRAIAESLGATTVPDVISMIKNNPDLAKFGSNISKGVAEELAQVAGNVTDPEVGQIYEKVARREAEKMGGQYKAATDKFLTEITTFEDTTQQRVSQSTGKKRSIGRASLFTNKKSYKSMGFGSIAAALGLPSTKGLVKAHMTGRQMSSIDSLSGQGNLSKAAIEAKARMDAKTYEETVKKTTEDPYMATRDRNSPHPQAIKDGKDDGASYAAGVQSGTKKASQSAQAIASRQALYGDGPITAIEKSRRRNAELVAKRGGTTQAAPKISLAQRLSGIGSKVAGKLGGGRGLGVSSGLMMASQFVPGKAGEIAGQASSIAFGLQALKMLPGPAKIAAAGFLAVAGTIKLFNYIQEKNRQKMEAFGDAIKNTTEQTDFLSKKFGFIATKNSLQRFDNSKAVSATQRTELEALKSDPEFKKAYGKSISGIKKLGNRDAAAALKFKSAELLSQGLPAETVANIMTAIQEEAGKSDLNIDFKSIKFDEKGLNSLASEVEKLSRKSGEKINKAFSQYEGMFEESVGAIRSDVFTDDAVMQKYEKEIKQVAEGVASFSNTLSNLAANGKITGDQLQKSVSTMFTSLGKNVKSTAGQMLIFRTAMTSINKKLGESVEGIKNTADAQAILAAATAGVSQKYILASIAAMTYASSLNSIVEANRAAGKAGYQSAEQAAKTGFANAAAGDARLNLKKLTDEALKAQKAMNDAFNGKGTGKGGGSGKDKWTLSGQLTDNIKALDNQKNAFYALRRAGIDAAFAMELVKDAQVAQAIVTKGVLTPAIIEQIKKYKEMQDKVEALEQSLRPYGERVKDTLAKEEARFNLEEEIVKSKYANFIYETSEALRNQQYELELVNRGLKAQEEAMAALVDPKQKRIDEIAYQLEGISFKEDAINEKYDKQSKLLSTITKMNQDLYSIQKKRVSLADALSSGDISAAASIIMDMRAEEASVQATSQQEVLDAAREQELAALGRLALEKESKKLQYEILTIQRSQSTALEDQAKKIQGIIDGLTNNLSDYEEAAADAVYAVSERLSSAFGRTKLQIQSAMSMIDLANVAGFDINDKTVITNILDAAIGKANELSKILGKLPNTGTGTGGGSTGGDTTGGDSSDTQKPETGARRYNGTTMEVWNGSAWVDAAKYDADKKKADDLAKSEAAAIALRKLQSGQTLTNEERVLLGMTPIADDRNAPGSNVETPVTPTVPHGAAPIDDSPAIVFPTEPVRTIPTGPSTDPNATQDEINRERGGYQNTGTATATVISDTVAAVIDKVADISIPSFDLGAIFDWSNIDWSSISLFSKGGIVPKYFANGGLSRGTDTIPAMLTPGEFVVNRRAAAGLGVNNLSKINNGEIPGGSVYNYKVDVTLNGSDMNPNDVANAVLTKIKQLESRNVRRQGI